MRPTHKVSPPRRRSEDASAVDFARLFEDALRTGDAAVAETVAENAIAKGLSAAAVQSRVIAPAMRRIGDLWQAGVLTVADEHLATAVSQNVLAKLFPLLFTAPPRSRATLVLAGAEGEHHVLGLRMAADVLEGAGFDVVYLGADVPADALVDACRRRLPAVVGITATMALNAPNVIAEIAALAELPEPPGFIVGGGALDPALQAGLNVRLVLTTEDVVAAVEDVMGANPGRPPVSAALLDALPGDSPVATGGADAVGTMADAFSSATLAANETARDAVRHSFDMEQLAYRDGLTGLWNRRAYDDRLLELASSADDGETRVLMLDVDEFKSVNDGWGHEAGDRALARVGRSILKSIRPTDFAARYGGDEFVVVLPGAGSQMGAAVAERIRIAVEQDTEQPPITVSVGLAEFHSDGRRTGLAVDQALYDAKRAGRNQVAQEGSA